MKRPSARWVHAARVASMATVVVAIVAALLVVFVNFLILRDLSHDVDNRLNATLIAASATPEHAVIPSDGHHVGDLDDVPDFVWHISPSGEVTALSAAAPRLPSRAWRPGGTTASTGGTSFRFAALPSGGGWLIAGESVARTLDVRGQLLVVELALGALLLLVTFTGSFIVGLRASAPIEQIRRRQAEFTADASHELRTPLSVIEAEVDLALERPRDADAYRGSLERIGSEGHRLRVIVEDLLWLARADGKNPDPEPVVPVDVAAIVTTATARFQAVASARACTLITRTESARPARVRGDQDGIDRLVTVLVDNACRYAGTGGTVVVCVSTTNGRVVLSVDDTGPGIPESARDLIFDRFHRADSSIGGTGLGLAIADAVVRKTAGEWSVTDSPQGGARFEVTWRQAAP